MNFGSPAVLARALRDPGLIGIYALAQRRRRKYVVRFTAVPVLAGVMASGGVSRWRRHLPAALLLAALATLLVALAKPQTTVAVPVEKASVMLVTDQSGSMRADDVSPYAPGRRPAGRARLPRQGPEGAAGRGGSFSDVPQSVSPPTTDRDDVRSLVDGLNADGGTAAGDALQSRSTPWTTRASAARAARPPRSSCSPTARRRRARTRSRSPATPASATSRSTPSRSGRPTARCPAASAAASRCRPTPRRCGEISKASGGTAYTANDADQLSGVYENLGSRLGTKQEEREITAVFAGGGLILLLGAAFAGLRTTGRLP